MTLFPVSREKVSSLRGWEVYSFSPSSRQSGIKPVLFQSSSVSECIVATKPAQNEETVKRPLHGLCHRSCGFLHPVGRESAIVHRARAEHQNPVQRLRLLFAGQHQYQPAALSRRHASIAVLAFAEGQPCTGHGAPIQRGA